jgi:hypothetical protein
LGSQGALSGLTWALSSHCTLLLSWMISCSIYWWHKQSNYRKISNDTDHFTLVNKVPVQVFLTPEAIQKFLSLYFFQCVLHWFHLSSVSQ